MTVLQTEPFMGNKTISLVLGSGGARSMAHIGVIRCLQEQGYTIRSMKQVASYMYVHDNRTLSDNVLVAG